MKTIYAIIIMLNVCLSYGQTTSAVHYIEYGIDTEPSSNNALGYSAFTPTQDLTVNLPIDISTLQSGNHTVWIRGLNDSGWTIPYYSTFYKMPTEIPSEITDVEYFIGMEAPSNTGKSIAHTNGPNVSIQTTPIDIGGLGEGLHTIRIQAKDSRHAWGTDWQTTFYKVKSDPISNITKLRYRLRKNNVLSNEYEAPGFSPSLDAIVSFTIASEAISEMGLQIGNTFFLELYALDENGTASIIYTSVPIAVQ